MVTPHDLIWLEHSRVLLFCLHTNFFWQTSIWDSRKSLTTSLTELKMSRRTEELLMQLWKTPCSMPHSNSLPSVDPPAPTNATMRRPDLEGTEQASLSLASVIKHSSQASCLVCLCSDPGSTRCELCDPE